MPEDTGRSRLLVAGDTTVDLYPEQGKPLEPGGSLRWHVGGTGFNVARAIGFLGQRSTLLTNIGDDMFGTLLKRYLRTMPVSTEFVVQTDKTSPLTLFVPEEAGGPGWNAWLDGSCFGFFLPESLDFEEFDWLQISGTTLPESVNQEEMELLLKSADRHEVAVSFDINGRANQWSASSVYRHRVVELLPYCDLVFASEEDLALAGVETTVEGLRSLLPDDATVIVFVTAGEHGATAAEVVNGKLARKEVVEAPEAPVADTAGAGDAFVSAVLKEVLNGKDDLSRLLTVGVAAGTATVATRGPFEKSDLSRYESILETLRRQN
jgi:sugar/nucleoside kinase (ribokinase family)